MSDIIPNITLTDFRKLKAAQLKRLKSCEVYSDGEYLFTFINGNAESSGYLRNSCANNAQAANAVAGENIEQVTEDATVHV
jgi:hypothetical protein